jgi:hypothetical protein
MVNERLMGVATPIAFRHTIMIRPRLVKGVTDDVAIYSKIMQIELTRFHTLNIIYSTLAPSYPCSEHAPSSLISSIKVLSKFPESISGMTSDLLAT